MRYVQSIQYAAWALLALGFVACQGEKEAPEARAVATSETYLTFAAKDAPAQTISVYADGSWAADTGEEWISVSPTSGSGPAEVTISVDDNYTGGVMDLPRTGTIIFQGGTALRRGQVTIQQAGDTYKGVRELTVTEVLDLDDEAVAKIPSATVAAITKGGFVLTDGTSYLYVQGARDVKVGDIVSLNGAKATFNNAPSFYVDELSVTSNGEFTYPTAPDLTEALGSYDGKSVVFGKVAGSLINGTLKIGSAQIIAVDPIDDLEIDKVDLHKVVLTGYAVGKKGINGYLVVTAIDDNGVDDTLVPYPLRWAMGSDLNYSSSTFNNDNPRIDPIQGIGYIEYVPYDLQNNNATNNYKLDVSGNNPRVTGPWVNDYWLFYGNGAIKAGTEVQIAFEMRSSKWGMKYWLLEYLDGDEWLTAGTPQTATDPGYEVLYTCATNEDGATNCPVMETIRFRKNNEHLQIRLRCSALWRGGGGITETRSTASSRLSVTDPNDDTYKPNIVILKEGDGVEKEPVYADIQTSVDLLTFNGTPTGPKTLTVTSDHDFTVSTAYDWLTLDVTEGVAGVETEIAVTCAESELAELREGTIRIVSEDSEKVVNVVQSAAGQMLDPFISVSSGNALEVSEEEGTSAIRVQSNTDFEYAVEADWLTLAKAETKAMVEWTDFVLTRTANVSEAPRTATVRFYNTEKNLEAVVTVTQAGKEIILDNSLIQWGFSADLMGAYKDAFEKDNAFKANIAGVGTLSWNNLPENVAIDQAANKKKTQVIGGTGQPYVTGVWPGDYWEFTIPIRNVAARSVVTFNALTQVSATGHKYWRMEYSLDGTTWTPVKALETETETGTSAQYTHIVNSSATTVSETFTLAEAVADGTLRIRFTCAANWQYKGSALQAPNGGTHRWAGAAENGPKITISEPEVPGVTFPVTWSFKEPGEDWKDGVDWHCENPTGSYVYSDTHEGKMTVVRFGDSPASAPTYKNDAPLGTRLLHYGMYKDDYWLFEVENVKNAAGTYTIGYGTSSSGAGPKFFALEYSPDEGATWTGINTQTKTEAWANGTNGREVTYTYALSYESNTANEVYTVTESFHLDAFKGKLMIRARVADTMQLGRTKEMTNASHGGTNRIGNTAKILFTAD